MSIGRRPSASLNLVAFITQVLATLSFAVILLFCLKLKKHNKPAKAATPKKTARDKYAENTYTEKSEDIFGHLPKESTSSMTPGRAPRSTPDKKLRTETTQDATTVDLQTCPSRELTRTRTVTVEGTNDLQSTATKSVTMSAYQPPPAPPRDIEKDRKRAKNALQIFCQREKKKNSEDDEEDEPTTNTQPPPEEQEEKRISAEQVKKLSGSNQKT